MSRPPLISSRVAAFLASMAGLWNEVAATSGPSWMRSVTAAIAASWVHASHGPRAGCVSLPASSVYRYRRWSPTQIESSPISSAASAISRMSAQRGTHSTSGSWTPTFIGLAMQRIRR